MKSLTSTIFYGFNMRSEDHMTMVIVVTVVVVPGGNNGDNGFVWKN